MTRRRTYRGLGLCGVALLGIPALQACGDDDADGTAGTASARTASAATVAVEPGTDEPDAIVVYGSAGLIEQVMNEQVLPGFEETTGIRVNYQGLPSADALAKTIAQRDNPEASLVMMNDTDATEGHLNELWAPIDAGSVPTIGELADEALSDDGTTVAITTGAWLVAANTEALEAAGVDPPASWLDLFDEPYAGRTVMHSFSLGQGPSVAWVMNQALGGTDDDFGPLLEFIEEDGDNVLSYATQSEWDQLISQGTAFLGTSPNTRVGIHASSGEPVELLFPEEGAVIFEIRAAIPTNAEAPAAASQLLDYLLQPEQQVLQSESLFYSPVHPDAAIDPEAAQFTVEGHEDELLRPDTEVLLEIKRDVIPQILEILEN